jgi:ribonuclease Z
VSSRSRRLIRTIVNAIAALLGLADAGAALPSPSDACPASGAAVQILGSGGPMHGGGRGSSAYLFRYDSEPIFVIDMGGDTPTALSRAGVDPGAISTLLISHSHPDHVAGIPDFLWGEMTAGRTAPLLVIGPPAADQFLDARTFFSRLLGSEGAYPDLQSLLQGNPFAIRFITAEQTIAPVLEWRGFVVTAMRVDHGRAPTLAFRVEGHGTRTVFAGDQRGVDGQFAAFAHDSDLLILHAMATDAVRDHSLARVIAAPSDLGALANRVRARSVVLSHLMRSPASSPEAAIWSLSNLPGVVKEIRKRFHGPFHVASDLQCFGVTSEAL